ncbi:sigma-70 family RNA polymerase sigma factor [Tautonia plasticadhaerens]|uniref:ECF RNA polymerase sigma-E factor n=1 Tax=Tautonia plasticadhaerens TaxID=2527974 RepID=A0A518H8I4_9BACT|nr:sigma-70 family RNA polymerase sigma factor [Tautonia plasticadhaerens]QDV37144.1 ECF RNA polymerase sigma-E factor [Tautonia plasticadhaerens]
MSLMAPLPTPESSFQVLLREARTGSKEARWLVVQLFRKTMLAIANEEVNLAIQCREAPSDIVQETILEAQEDLDRFHGLTEQEMRAWLKQVLVRNISNVNRKYRTDKRNVRRERSLSPQTDGATPVIPDPGPSPSTVLVRRETAEALEVAIQGLPDHYRQVIHLRYRKGLSYEEIAQAMNRTEMATRRLWSRALHELSRRMKIHLG